MLTNVDFSATLAQLGDNFKKIDHKSAIKSKGSISRAKFGESALQDGDIITVIPDFPTLLSKAGNTDVVSMLLPAERNGVQVNVQVYCSSFFKRLTLAKNEGTDEEPNWVPNGEFAESKGEVTDYLRTKANVIEALEEKIAEANAEGKDLKIKVGVSEKLPAIFRRDDKIEYAPGRVYTFEWAE